MEKHTAEMFGMPQAQFEILYNEQIQSAISRLQGHVNISTRIIEELALAKIPPENHEFNPRKFADTVMANAMARLLMEMGQEKNVVFSL